jgi:hypothetical protein
MSRKILILGVCFCLSSAQLSAQITEVISIVQTAIKKVVEAADLAVQKIQNQTIWLQDAQKTLENSMSELDLDDITDWVEKTKDLYQEYYSELAKVKQIISDYDAVKTVVETQKRIFSESSTAYALFKQDKHFSSSELSYMSEVYSGILSESVKNLDQLLLAVQSFVTQMSDGKRLDLIQTAAKGMQKNYSDLKQFNSQSVQLSLERSADAGDLKSVMDLYGLE